MSVVARFFQIAVLRDLDDDAKIDIVYLLRRGRNQGLRISTLSRAESVERRLRFVGTSFDS